MTITISDQQNKHQHATIDHNTPEEGTKEMTKDDPIKEKLDIIFKRNYQNYIIKETEQWTIPTKLNKKIDQNIVKVENEIRENHLCSLKTINCTTNSTIYCITVSCKEIISDLPTKEIQNKKYNKPKWIVNFENSIKIVWREIAHTQVVSECKTTKQSTKHQPSLLHRLKTKNGNIKMITFTTKLSILKLELKSKVKKLRHHKKLPEYKRIDNQFFYNPKQVYWLMKGDDISIENVSMKVSVESSWKGIWEEGTTFKNKADWLPQLEIMYCNKVIATEDNINRTILDKVIQKLQINKVLGNDHITGYWYKHLTTYRDQLTELFQHQIHSDQPLPYCH